MCAITMVKFCHGDKTKITAHRLRDTENNCRHEWKKKKGQNVWLTLQSESNINQTGKKGRKEILKSIFGQIKVGRGRRFHGDYFWSDIMD